MGLIKTVMRLSLAERRKKDGRKGKGVKTFMWWQTEKYGRF